MEPASATKATTFRLTADAGKWTGGRLGGMPQGGTLQVELTTDGSITVCLLDVKGYESLPVIHNPLFSAETANDLAFSINIRESEDYFLVADNRHGDAPRRINVSVKVSAPETKPQRGDYVNMANALLGVIEKAIHLVFDLESNPESSDAAPSHSIHLSTDFSLAVFDATRDQETASNVLLFSLFYQISSGLLQRSGAIDTSVAEVDELAAALLVMFGYTDRARIQANYLSTSPIDQTVAMATGIEPEPEPYLPTAERAQQVAMWLDDSALLERWESVFLRTMQTEVLEGFLKETAAWTTAGRVKQELANRRRH